MPRKYRRGNPKRSSIKRMARAKASSYKPRRKLTLIGTSIAARDRARHAKRPGKRVSSDGRIYYERRRNRADLNPVSGL